VTVDPHAVLDRELAAIASDPARPLASVSVLAIRHGEVVYSGQFGRRHIDPDKPVDAATLYRIASISKLVTTLGALRLVEDGKLALDADIGDYLGYRVRNPNFPDMPITLRMLLTHTSSLRDNAGYYWESGTRIEDFLTPGGPLHGTGGMWSAEAKPGARFTYANLGWGVLGTLMEKASGERFDLLMRRLVLDPLGMQGGYDAASLAPERLANLATLYRKRATADDAAWNPAGPWVAQTDDFGAEPPRSRAGPGYVIGSNATPFSPTGGLRASPADLARVMRMLMNGGELDGRRVLKPETVATMLSIQWRNDGSNGESNFGSHRGRFNAWGLGNERFLDISGPAFGDRIVEGGGFAASGHIGEAYGLIGLLAFDATSKDGIVYLVGGTGFDPETDRGTYSAGFGFEERIATALYRRAILGRAD
jgi:CubicO group peptidase (beta-lactamase class C family)